MTKKRPLLKGLMLWQPNDNSGENKKRGARMPPFFIIK